MNRNLSIRCRTIAAMLLAAIVCAPIATIAEVPPAEDPYAAALDDIKAERWTAAVESIRTALKTAPEDPRATPIRFYLGEALMRIDRPTDAAIEYREYLESENSDKELAAFRLVEALYFAKDYASTIVEANSFLESNPESEEGLVVLVERYRCVSLYSVGDYESTEAAAARFTADHPDNPLANEIVSYQATCLLFFDRTAAAWAVIASQLDVPAQSPEKTCAESLAGNVLLQLGEEAMVAGRPDDAEQWFHRLLRRLPTHKDCPNAATRLAEIAYDRGDFPEAAVRYEVVIARGDVAPENAPGLWYGLISSYSQNQQWDEVVDLAVKAKAKHSDWPCAYDFDYLRGRALFAKAELNDARAAFALVIAAPASTGTETGVLAHFMTAETYSLQNNLESALAEYELAAAGPIPEWQITGHMTCGKLREHLGRYEEAARDYERITRDHPDAPEAEDAERCRAACLAQAGVNKNLERK